MGFTIFHMVHSDDKTIHYFDKNCFSDKIDQKFKYLIGFGSAVDSSGNIFKVRIFLSSKEGILFYSINREIK